MSGCKETDTGTVAPTGIQPDRPDGTGPAMDAPAESGDAGSPGTVPVTDGIRPDRPDPKPTTRGIQPDRPVSKGLRPDRPDTDA